MIQPTLFYLQINIFAMIILFIIFLNVHKRGSDYSFSKKIFALILFACFLLIFSDTILWIINGKPGKPIRYLSVFFIVLYNMFNPVICMLWHYYVDYHIFGDKKRIFRVFMPVQLPVVLNTLLCIASIFTDVYHVFDVNNVYHRGRFIYLLFVLCFYMVLYTELFLFRNRKKISAIEYKHLLFFPLPPALGAIVQFLYPGLSLIWAAATLSIFLAFINIQKTQMNIDYLTGVYNRRYLDKYLQVITKTCGNKRIAGIMIDIDYFKIINDAYGHEEGDEALKYTAQILRNTFRKMDFIARYGGDEFIVILELDDSSELEAVINRLKNNVKEFNTKKMTPYEIVMSVGYGFYEKDSGISEFLKRIDDLMYMDKKGKQSVSIRDRLNQYPAAEKINARIFAKSGAKTG